MALQFKLCKEAQEGVLVEIYKECYDDDTQTIKHALLKPLKTLDVATLKAFAEKNHLDQFEQFQLYNYADSLQFNQQEFKVELDELQSQQGLHITPGYQAAIFELWKLAKIHHIDFNPALTQERALLNKAKAVERELNKHLGYSVNVLTKIKVDIKHLPDENLKKRIIETGQALFQLIMTIKKATPPEICHTFNTIANERYQKHAQFKPRYIKMYATQIKRYPLWYCTVAIDVLMHYGINPTHHLPAANVAAHWIRLKEAKYTLDSACADFMLLFQVQSADATEVQATIKQHYEKGLSTANI